MRTTPKARGEALKHRGVQPWKFRPAAEWLEELGVAIGLSEPTVSQKEIVDDGSGQTMFERRLERREHLRESSPRRMAERVRPTASCQVLKRNHEEAGVMLLEEQQPSQESGIEALTSNLGPSHFGQPACDGKRPLSGTAAAIRPCGRERLAQDGEAKATVSRTRCRLVSGSDALAQFGLRNLREPQKEFGLGRGELATHRRTKRDLHGCRQSGCMRGPVSCDNVAHPERVSCPPPSGQHRHEDVDRVLGRFELRQSDQGSRRLRDEVLKLLGGGPALPRLG